jgi:hypothetical protein
MSVSWDRGLRERRTPSAPGRRAAVRVNRAYAEAVRPPTTALIAAGSLVAGFAVADLTGVRPLGGAVLLVAAALCGRAWQRRAGAGVAVVLLLLYAAAFAAAHPLARVTGAWPAVLLVAAVVGGVALLLTRRPADRTARVR